MADESTDLSPPDQARANASRRTELLIGSCVVLISLISLFVAVSANRTQERLLAASNWPYLQFTTGNADDSGKPVISLNLINSGVGPARIRAFDMRYHGKSVRDSRALLSACCLHPEPHMAPMTTSTSAVNRRVLAPNEQIAFLRVARQPHAESVWQALDRERFNVQLRVCYCSVLDDCWMLDTGKPEPEAVKACPATPADGGWGN